MKKWIIVLALLCFFGVAFGTYLYMNQEIEVVGVPQGMIVSPIGNALTRSIEPCVPQIIEEATPVITNVTISAVGDCALGTLQLHSYQRSFGQFYDTYGADYFFENVRSIFEADDFTLVNLECVLSESNNRVEKTFNIKGKPEYTQILTGSSIEACSLGNNHTADYGPESHEDTEKALNDAGVIFGYKSHVDTYTTDEGVIIGVVSSSLFSHTEWEENLFQNGIQELREQGADIVIACCHWGIEGDYYPTQYQIDTAHKIIDWGADVLIGHHPHVLQGMEEYQGRIICYSLGNFCFGANHNPDDWNTLIFQQTFTFVNGEKKDNLEASITPCLLSSAKGYNNYQPIVADEKHWEKIIDKMNTYSKQYSGITFDGNGTICVPIGE